MKVSRLTRIVLCALLLSLCSASRSAAGQEAVDASKTGKAPGRNPAWAEKIRNEHLPNFFKVGQNLYRGAQPGPEGFKELERMGVRTVINLRQFHSDKDDIQGTSLGCKHIRMAAFHPEDEDTIRFLKIVGKTKDGPFFVHCQHGSDRTGLSVAFYRIVFQGWTKDKAIKEMTEGGFGFHRIWTRTLIPYIRDADIAGLRRRAGLRPGP